METIQHSAPIAGRSPNVCSKVTNGVDLLRGIDGRSADERRYRDLVESYKAEFSHDLSQSEMAAVKQAAWLTVRSEGMQAAQLRGEAVSYEESTRLACGG
jgi:hypothetical protein